MFARDWAFGNAHLTFWETDGLMAYISKYWRSSPERNRYSSARGFRAYPDPRPYESLDEALAHAYELLGPDCSQVAWPPEARRPANVVVTRNLTAKARRFETEDPELLTACVGSDGDLLPPERWRSQFDAVSPDEWPRLWLPSDLR
jgi:hypothetical protein